MIRSSLLTIISVCLMMSAISTDVEASLYMGRFGPNQPVNFGVNGWDTTWIIWSNPLVNSNITARDLIADAGMEFGGTQILVVTNLNSTSMLYNSYVDGDPESQNFKLEDGRGYWLWTYDSGWIPTVGWTTNGSLNVTVHAGWNILGVNIWKYTESWSMYIKASDILKKNTNLSVVSMMYYDEGMGDHTPIWSSYVKGDSTSRDFQCWIGSGIYVWADRDCNISW